MYLCRLYLRTRQMFRSRTLISLILLLAFEFAGRQAAAYTANDDHQHPPTRVLPAQQTKSFADYIDPVFANYPVPKPDTATTKVREFRVIVLSDMIVNRRTHAEWGYAAYIDGIDAQGNRFSVLFDTGAETGTVWYNLQKLVDPDNAKANMVSKVCQTTSVILSHNHQDHVAGLLTLRRNCVAAGYPDALKTAILGGREATWSRQDRTVSPHKENNYLLRPAGPGPADDPNAGTIEQQYSALGGTFVYADVPQMIAPGVWTSGKVFRTTGEKEWWQFGETGPLVSNSGGEYHDNIPEDHGLVINTRAGLVVLTGCGHAGIVNIIKHAREHVIAGLPKVGAVMGGVHLFSAKPSELDFVVQGLKDAGVNYMIGSHCTGIEALMYLRPRAKLKETDAVVGTVGTVLRNHPVDLPKLEVTWLSGAQISKHPSLN